MVVTLHVYYVSEITYIYLLSRRETEVRISQIFFRECFFLIDRFVKQNLTREIIYTTGTRRMHVSF